MIKFELSPQVFSILSSLIQEKVGLYYGLSDRDILLDKVSVRAEEKGFESLLDYYYFLRYDGDGAGELKELVESLVVNETYFFREWAAIEVLVHHHLKPMCDAGKRPKIWCAAASTGEEPLSLAMLLEANGILDKVDIVASDISENALNKARSGKFGRRSVRSVPDKNLLDKFITAEENAYKISPHLCEKIRWQRINILDEADYPQDGPFDAILCRNLLIYFSDQTVKKVLDSLSTKLTWEGLLLVGISESLLRFGCNFIGEERAGSFVYRKANQI